MSVNRLIKNIQSLSSYIQNLKGFTAILTHYDADGISSGGIFARLFSSLNKKFILRSTPDLSDEVLNEFFSITAQNYIILDMGSGDIRDIYDKWRILDGDKLIVIDHHKILQDIPDDPNLTLLNPELYDLDGGKFGCTSVLTSLISYFISYDPYHLEIGVVGATGDMQLLNDVKEINRVLLDLAIKENMVEKERDFIFFVNKNMPLYRAITWNYIPYIPGFSGRDDIGFQIMRKADIPIKRDDEYTTVKDLSDTKKEKILEVILQYLTSLGIKDLDVNQLIVDRYILLREDDENIRTSVDFANLLSGLGRMQREYLGILLAAGVRGRVLEEALKVQEERRHILVKYLDMAENSVSKYDNIAIIDLRTKDFDHRFSGTISTFFSRSITLSDKIIIVLSKVGESVKISARAPRVLVDKGLNLAYIMSQIAKKLSGKGGGHNIAAGATVKDSKNLIDTILDVFREYGNV